MRLLAPSMLSSDFLHLEKDVEFVNNNADIFHIDVMDGVLVPNISFGFPVIEAIAKKSSRPLDLHLMISDPDKYIDRFVKAGASMISFHLEACDRNGSDPLQIIEHLHSSGVKAGVAINPDIPVERVFPLLDKADYIVIMSVFAGFGGQKFIEETYIRIKAVKEKIKSLGRDCLIEIDGGVSSQNADKLAECGADIFVAGSAVFKAADRVAECKGIKGIR